MASEGLEYSEVALLVRGALNAGRLKLHKSGAVFKASKTGKVDHINKEDIESANWLRVARGYELKVVLNSGVQFRFEGFKENDYSNLSEFLSQFYDIKIKDVELSVKGWNWGTAKFKGTSLSFEVDDKPAFEIPLTDVSQATTAGNNEVTLEFHQHDDAEVSLMEMRFYIPTAADNIDTDPVKTFHEQVVSKADIIQITGDAIVTIPDVACLTPRGRYTMKVFPAFMQLHGKTYDYKVPYTTILRLFLLPHKDQRFMFFVVSMDPPIKQGQTRYPFLITQFEKHEEFDVKLNMSEEEIKEKYGDKVTQEMSGPVYEIISRLMKAVVGKKITVPGTFKSHSGASGMTCSYRAGSGLLYPLERGFIFVHKPPVHVRFDEIGCVNFARVSGGGSSSRSFDFEIETKSGSVIVFSSIEREEYSKLFDFVNAKKLRIKNTGKVKVKKSNEGKYDDDLFNSDEDQHDAYLEQVKAEAAERDSESEDDDSDDESFAPDEEDDRDVKEEFDSDASSSEEEGSGGESDEQTKKKKQKEKPEKKRKAEKERSPKKKAKANTFIETTIKRTKTGKRKKDPNAPKRAMSAYMLWLGDKRQEFKDEHPGISVTEISKLAGERWRKVDDKSKWEKQAAIEKEKYQAKMKDYKQGLLEAGTASTSKKKDSPKKSTKKADSKEKKKEEKKGSPRKSTDGQKFKSAEFIETSGDSSDSEGEKRKKKKSKSPSKKKKKEESEEESMDEEVSEKEEMSAGSDSE